MLQQSIVQDNDTGLGQRSRVNVAVDGVVRDVIEVDVGAGRTQLYCPEGA